MSGRARDAQTLGRLARPRVFLPLLVGLALLASHWFAGARLPSADEGALLTNAVKLLRGGVFYRDVDAYPFPLSHYLLAGWMGLFGEHLAISRGLAGLFFALAVAGLYAAALPLLGARRAALFGLSLLGFKLLAWPAFTAYLYSEVAFAFACVAVALLVRHRFAGPTPALAAAGVATGLAILSKQNLGIYLAGAAAACLLAAGPVLGVRRAHGRGWREGLVFAAGAVVPVAAMAAYFARYGLLGAMIQSGLLSPFTGYLPTSGISFWKPLQWWRLGDLQGQAGVEYLPLPVWELLMFGRLPAPEAAYPAFWLAAEVFARALYTSVPVAFVAAGVLWLRTRGGDRAAERPLLVLAALTAAAVLSAFPRADFSHVIGVYPLVLLLLFALWGRLGARAGRAHPRLARAEAGAVALALLLFAALAVVDRRALSHHLVLERADLRVAPSQAWLGSVVRFVRDHTDDDDRIFVYGQEAGLYFLTGRLFPWRFSQLYPGQAGEDDGEALLALVRREQPALVLRGMMAWPGLPSLGSYTSQLDLHVQSDWTREERVFEEQPLPAGQEPPPWWLMSVLRPCRPGAGCVPFGEFMPSAPAPWKEPEG